MYHLLSFRLMLTLSAAETEGRGAVRAEAGHPPETGTRRGSSQPSVSSHVPASSSLPPLHLSSSTAESSLPPGDDRPHAAHHAAGSHQEEAGGAEGELQEEARRAFSQFGPSEWRLPIGLHSHLRHEEECGGEERLGPADQTRAGAEDHPGQGDDGATSHASLLSRAGHHQDQGGTRPDSSLSSDVSSRPRAQPTPLPPEQSHSCQSLHAK